MGRKVSVFQGLAITLRELEKTKNEAASAVLVPALDCANVVVQEGALQAILKRKSPTGQREIVKRLHVINDRWRAIIEENHGRMGTVLRDAVLSDDEQFRENGCRAALWFREYDLMPVLLNAAEDENHPDRNRVAETILKLAELLYDELAAPRDYKKRRDPQQVRERILVFLEKSVQRYSKHRRTEILEAFLLLVGRDNATLKQVLLDPLHTTFLPLTERLAHSPRSGVMRLLLTFLDDSHAPSAGLHALAKRSDPKFIEHLLRKIGTEPSSTISHNLKRIDQIPWLQNASKFLEALDEIQQHSAVQLGVRSGLSRQDIFQLLDLVLRNGKVGGRRAAAHALAPFSGAEANALALGALHDADPFVKAQICLQLRPRGIPGAMSKLVELLDSPHEPVRNAARQGLDEFNFKKYLQTFDLLEEENRRSSGQLVFKIDPSAPEGLRQELTAQSRNRRLRALAITTAMACITQVEAEVTQLLNDDDYVIRCEAARALALGETPAAWDALCDALTDRSVVVREMVEESLRTLAERHPELAPSGDPLAEASEPLLSEPAELTSEETLS